jgi:Bacterial Ig domain
MRFIISFPRRGKLLSFWLQVVAAILVGSSGLVAANPPSAQLASPVNGSFAVAPAVVALQATATDTDGTIQTVEFFTGTNSLSILSNAPFRFIWTNPPAGAYELTAVATDNDSLSVTSAVTALTILTNGSSVRVMPLGDSLTSGEGYLANLEYHGAYRIRLRQMDCQWILSAH